MQRLKRWSLTCFGLGLLWPAPGTWGSLPAAALAWALWGMGQRGVAYVAALLAVGALASAACLAWTAQHEQLCGRKDPREIVADEVAGQALTALALAQWLLPAQLVELTGAERWLAATALAGGAFVLFRLFDIVKPFPANRAQALSGGLGVLLDDLVAGLYAGLVTLGGAWLVVAALLG